MPSHQDQYFLQACKALTQIPGLRKTITKAHRADAPNILQIMEREEPLPEELSGAYDHVLDFLRDEAPEVDVSEAEQGKGVYQVTIRGFPGAYFVQALEYDDSEVFTTLAAAESYVSQHFGEFLC